MLEACTKLMGLVIMTLAGFYIIKDTIISKEKLLDKRNIAIILGFSVIPLIIYKVEYKSIYTLITFLINIIIYKLIFKENLQKTILLTSVVMLLTFLADLICGIVMINFSNIEKLRSGWYNRIFLNVLIGIVSVLLYKILKLKKIPNKLNTKLQNINNNSISIFLLLIVIVFTIVTYNLYINFNYNIIYIANLLTVLIFIALLYIFLKEKDNYSTLINEYDNLFSYVQNFEDWIEKEQLNRHEYKNQLAVLRCLTKEKKVKNKIDEILEDNINIEGEVVHQLKTLPKGGLKGLMYYKSAIAQKNKINLVVDVSLDRKSTLSKLSEKDIRVLCKLIGIYFDNAIEAAKETRKKNVLVEIYELKDKVNFVISNTFKKTKNFDKRNEKGVSSKGNGHGNGLYFAKNLISKNDWLSQRQDIIDGYYIQELSIKKLGK